MALTSRRVEISFDRERDAFRTLFDAVATFRRASRSAESHLIAAADAPMLDPSSGVSEPISDVPREIPRLDDDRDRRAPAPISKAGRYLATLADAYGALPTHVLAAETPFVDTLVLDASAVAALAAGDMRVRAHLARAVGSLARIVVPATSLRDGSVDRIARSFAEIVTIDAAHVRLAAELIVKAPGSDPYDALAIACGARAERGAVVTARADELEPLRLAAAHHALYVFSI